MLQLKEKNIYRDYIKNLSTRKGDVPPVQQTKEQILFQLEVDAYFARYLQTNIHNG